MNSPDGDVGNGAKTSKMWLAAGLAAVTAVAVVVGLAVFGSGDDPPPSETAGESVPSDTDVESAGEAEPEQQISGEPEVDTDLDASDEPELIALDEAPGGLDEEPIDDFDDFDGAGVPEEPVGLAEICVDIRHQPIDEQGAPSGIWVSGAVYGLPEGTWIWVEGPTINGGDPVQIPVEDNRFEGGLGITSYGEHVIDSFRLGGDEESAGLYETAGQLESAFDGPISVDADEGSPFDDDCFLFDEPASALTTEPDDASASDDPLAEARDFVELVMADFVGAHVAGDTDRLLETLHPDVPASFGDEVCAEYVLGTTGSIVGAEVVDVGLPGPHQLTTPNGVLEFDDAIPATIEFEVFDGSTLVNEAHFPVIDGEAYWLTTCGTDTP